MPQGMSVAGRGVLRTAMGVGGIWLGLWWGTVATTLGQTAGGPNLEASSPPAATSAATVSPESAPTWLRERGDAPCAPRNAAQGTALPSPTPGTPAPLPPSIARPSNPSSALHGLAGARRLASPVDPAVELAQAPPTPSPSIPPAPAPRPRTAEGADAEPPSPEVVRTTPATPTPPVVGAPKALVSEELIDRLRKMEEMNQSLLQQVDKVSKENEKLSKKYDDLSKRLKAKEDQERESREKDEKKKKEEDQKTFTAVGGVGGGTSGQRRGSSGGITARAEAQGVGNRHLGRIPLKVSYNYGREGFQLDSADDELQLKVRGELQADSMIYQQEHQDPTHSGFYIPRVRFYFQGRVTQPIEYQISFQRSYDTFAPLNVFLNFNYDKRLQFRIGRFKVPYQYEWYKQNNWRLINPERSLYTVNFGLNRQIGFMGWGELFDRRMEYAVGIFDGPRNSFQDFNNQKDVIAFLNFTPWERTNSFLKNLNVGGSVDYGVQDNPLRPVALRTNVNASTSPVILNNPSVVDNATVAFLQFNNNVIRKGLRELWELHLAYFYKGLSLLGSWDAAAQSYSLTGAGNRPVRLPVSGYYVQAAYILTGETLNERAVIDPIHPFDLRPGKFGLGAFELTGRYSELTLGRQVFTSGLADPNLWSNKAQMIDLGMNWYLNKAVKIYFDWEHAIFGQPVLYAPGPRLQKTSDLFWLRAQLYY